MENITPESWQKARDDLDWEHNHPRTLMSRSYGYQEAYIKAWSFATAAHQGQKVPSTDYPYINHIGLVAMEALSTIANEEEIDNPELLIQCALLHDTIEDTDCSHADLKREFGSDVADGVLSLSKDATLTTKAERMNDCLLRIKLQPKEIWMVKLCDRITNLQPPPKHWDIKKIRAYRYEAELILKELGEANEYLAKRLSRKIENYKSHLNQPEELFVQSFGCPECHKPAESLAKFDDMPLQKVVTLHDKSHHSFWISECKHCRQPYLEEFEDDIDWSGGGDDPMWHFWMPLTEDEHDTLTEDYVDLDLLSSIMRKRKFLILDSNSKFKWSSE